MLARKLLSGGDRRSIGEADKAASRAARDTAFLAELVRGLVDGDEVVRMRCADAVEKATRARPDLLQPHVEFLLETAARSSQQEVRWHLAQVLPRLELSRRQTLKAVLLLTSYLEDESSIVKTFAMQAFADLALRDPALRPRVAALLERLTATGTPAMKARGRKLLRALELPA